MCFSFQRMKTALGYNPWLMSTSSGWDCSPASSLATCATKPAPQSLNFQGGEFSMQLACHTEGHLLKSVTLHTFASAGGLPHAALTIWIERF